MRILIIGEHSYIGNAFLNYIINQKTVKINSREEKKQKNYLIDQQNSKKDNLIDQQKKQKNSLIEQQKKQGKNTKVYLKIEQDKGIEVQEQAKSNSILENKESIMEMDYWIVDKVGASSDQWREKDFSGYDVVLHVAALVHKKESKYGKEQYEKVNYQKVIEVARKAKKENVKQFIFLSTMAVYGEDVSRITEKTSLSPSSYYGKSKLKAERKLETMRSELFRIAIIRPPMVYGEHCSGNYTRLKKLAYYMPIFPSIENKRSMISIERLNKCLKLVVERQLDGIICPRDKNPMQTTKLYKKMRKAIGKNTWTFSLGSRITKIGCNKISILKKLFGDCYYDFQEKELLEVWEYQ